MVRFEAVVNYHVASYFAVEGWHPSNERSSFVHLLISFPFQLAYLIRWSPIECCIKVGLFVVIPREVFMDLLATVAQGFQTVDAEPIFRENALVYLKMWLEGAEYAEYRPQIEWQIATAKWAALL